MSSSLCHTIRSGIIVGESESRTTNHKEQASVKNRIIIFFLIYGVVVGLLSAWWWHVSDNIFLPNVPGELLGYEAYTHSIIILGNPYSDHAHYTIPLILRIPQVFIPVSIAFWTLVGLAIQAVYNIRTKRSISQAQRGYRWKASFRDKVGNH